MDKKVDKLDDASDETKEIVKKVKCAVTRKVVSTKPEEYIAINNNPKTHEHVDSLDVTLGWKQSKHNDGEKWTKSGLKAREEVVTPSFTTHIIEYSDLNAEDRKKFVQLQGSILRSDVLFPLDDNIEYFKDNEEALRVMKDLKITQGEAMPVTYNTDFNMETDESFSRIFFYGIGACLIAKSEEVTGDDAAYGPFVVDLPFQGLKVRNDRFKGFGARVHFNEDKMVTAIYDYIEDKLVKPGDDDWEATKMHAKVTVFSVVTVREHLTWSHLIVSNDASREVVLELHPEHPIRRLLAVFTYNTVNVNRSAFEGLVPDRSLVHRALPLEYEGGVKDIFEASYTGSLAYAPFPDRHIKNPAVKKIAAAGGFPYLTEGIEYFEIVREFVRDWLEHSGDASMDEYAVNFYNAMKKASEGQAYELPSIESPDAMVNLLSVIIFTVTGFHEIIGHVVDYTDLPTKAGFRITKDMPKDKPQIDIQSFFLASIISSFTSVRMPKLMREFPNFFSAGGAPEWEAKVWKSFQAKMVVQSKIVQDRDAKRDFEFKYFDPSHFECSISV